MGHNAVFGYVLRAVAKDLVMCYGPSCQKNYQGAEVHTSYLKACHILQRDCDTKGCTHISSNNQGLYNPCFTVSAKKIQFSAMAQRVHRQNVEVTNPESTKRRTTKHRKTKRRMDKTSNGKNAEWYKTSNGKNVDWDKRSNSKKHRMEKTPNGKNAEWYKMLNEKQPNGTKRRMKKCQMLHNIEQKIGKKNI